MSVIEIIFSLIDKNVSLHICPCIQNLLKNQFD